MTCWLPIRLRCRKCFHPSDLSCPLAARLPGHARNMKLSALERRTPQPRLSSVMILEYRVTPILQRDTRDCVPHRRSCAGAVVASAPSPGVPRYGDTMEVIDFCRKSASGGGGRYGAVTAYRFLGWKTC